MYEWRWTEAMSPEILALVLRGRVTADEVARGAAQVCRAWRLAVLSPDMWGDMDIEAWCCRSPTRRLRVGNAPEALHLPRWGRRVHLRRSLVSHTAHTNAWSA